MITLTKEWLLKTIAELEEERDATPGAVNEDAAKALAAMKLALASLEAEPVISHLGSKNALDAIVAFIKSNRNPTLKDYNEVSERLFQDNCHGLSNHVIEYIKQIGEELEELRSTQDTAPPAPVVPDEIESTSGSDYDDYYCDGWNACRAAMLQGADNEIQRKSAIHDALCAKYNVESLADFVDWQSNHIAELEAAPPAPVGEGETAVMPDYPGYVMTQRECFEAGKKAGMAELVTTTNKLPDGLVACSEKLPPEGYEPDGGAVCYLVLHKNECDCGPRYSISNVFFLRKHWERNFTHWMPLPAAPQQEVK